MRGYTTLSPEFTKWAREDSTVYSHLMMGDIAGASLDHMLEGLAIQLAREKKQYFDQIIKLTELSAQPPKMLVPKGFKLTNSKYANGSTLIEIQKAETPLTPGQSRLLRIFAIVGIGRKEKQSTPRSGS